MSSQYSFHQTMTLGQNINTSNSEHSICVWLCVCVCRCVCVCVWMSVCMSIEIDRQRYRCQIDWQSNRQIDWVRLMKEEKREKKRGRFTKLVLHKLTFCRLWEQVSNHFTTMNGIALISSKLSVLASYVFKLAIYFSLP